MDIFNSPTLLNPQMDYLYFLQNIRLAAPKALSDFFMCITTFGEALFSTMFVAIIYWCVNKKYGEFLILSSSIGYVVNQLLKLTFCIYRPWILDSRITPYAKALPGAYGYSLPSGHASGITLNFGGAALCFKSKIFRIFCLLIILLVAFSRNFLGVHSLQDVVVGFIHSCFILLLIKYFLEKADLKNNKLIDSIFTIFIVVISFVFLYYIKIKSYPMDYMAGKLLVDPVQMQKGMFKAAGLLIGSAIGLFFERHYINFQISQNIYKRVLDGVIGFAIIFSFVKLASKYIILTFGINTGFLIINMIIGLFITVIYPILIEKINNNLAK